MALVIEDISSFVKGDSSSLHGPRAGDYAPGMPTELAQRIRSRLAEMDMSPRKAALTAGLPEARIRDILNGKSKSPRADTIGPLARALGLTADQLMVNENLGAKAEVPLTRGPRLVDIVTLPVRYQVEAGAWREVENVDYGWHSIPAMPRFAGFRQWLEQVTGDSMDRLIQPGSLVHVVDVIDMGYAVQDGDIVVVERRRAGLHERSLKQVERTAASIALWPRSNSPRWQAPLDIAAPDGDEVEIVGLVVADYRVWK